MLWNGAVKYARITTCSCFQMAQVSQVEGHLEAVKRL
jgi:hypothetical protein